MPNSFRATEIPGVFVLERRVFPDERGWFSEAWTAAELREHGLPDGFVQENLAWSHRDVVRGLHFQRPPAAQGKLVSALVGEVWDVAVDLRRGSPTFGRWHAETLSADNRRTMWIPEGFAHGYAVLSPEALVIYRATAPYAPEAEGGVAWDDPELAIPWPVTDPILSARDAALPRLAEVDAGIPWRGASA